MIEDIRLMIELQEIWDIVLKSRSDYERGGKRIMDLEADIKNSEKEIQSHQNNIKELKSRIKQQEIELSERDEQIKKLEAKRNILKTGREVEALENELKKASSEKSSLEDLLLTLFDELEQKEKDLEKEIREAGESKKTAHEDIIKLGEKNSLLKNAAEENEKIFNDKAENLSPDVRMKFLKLVKSSTGRAIAPVEGEICTSCNFRIPAHLVAELLKSSRVVNCTNCGRYIYHAAGK